MGVAGDVKAQQEVWAFGDADAAGGLDFFRWRGVGEDEIALRDVATVMLQIDREGAGKFSGAVGGETEACNWFYGADEDAAGGARGFGDDVEAVVDAIRKIDIGVTGGAEYNAGAGGDAGCGVGGEVGLTEIALDVGFGFDDSGANLALPDSVKDDFAEQIAGYRRGIARVKAAG